jgi:hypothetical protein
VGGTNLRYVDLVAGVLPNGTEVFATVVTYPFTALGESLPIEQRPNILARVSDIVKPISSTSLAVRQASLDDPEKRDLLVRFLCAMYTANLILNDPCNKVCVAAAIQKQLDIEASTAALDYTAAVNNVLGEISPGDNFTVSQLGLRNIINIRREFNGFTGVPTGFNFTEAIAPGVGNLIDYSIRDKAVAKFRPNLLLLACRGNLSIFG